MLILQTPSITTRTTHGIWFAFVRTNLEFGPDDRRTAQHVEKNVFGGVLGDLREKIFSQAVEDALSSVRNEMCAKYKPKKENRFFTNGITYEIGPGKLIEGGVQFEISSKIPVEMVVKKGMNVRYFREIRDIMKKGFKKPAETRMENIIRSTNINEIKERDYVKCVFSYKNGELYDEQEVERVVKAASSGKQDLSGIHGVATLAGRAVIYLINKNVHEVARKNIMDMVKANEVLLKRHAKLISRISAEVAAKIGRPAEVKARKTAPKKKAAKKTAPKKGRK